MFDTHDVVNVRCDTSLLEGKIKEDKKSRRQYPDLIEHMETLCQNGGSKDTKYLDEKPKYAVKWINKSIQDMENDSGDLFNPKYKIPTIIILVFC